MAILKYVDTASTAGGDGTTNATTGANRAYATLDAALESLAGTTLSDVTIIECAASGGAADTTQALPSATITTSAANYLHIRAATAHRAVLTSWDTSRYRLSPGNTNALDLTLSLHVLVEGLQIECAPASTSSSRYAVLSGNVAGTAKFLTLLGVRIRLNAAGTGTDHRAVSYALSGGTFRCVNSVIECIGSNVANCTGLNIRSDVSNTSVLYSTTIYGGAIGVSYTGTALKAVNTLTASVTDGWSSSTFRAGTDYNASSVASDAPGANSRNAQTFSFENAASGDYRLTTVDAGARTYGTDLSSDADYAYSVDMAGTTRTVPWDIGAHQVSVATTTTPAFGRYGIRGPVR